MNECGRSADKIIAVGVVHNPDVPLIYCPNSLTFKELGLNIPELEKVARQFTEVNGIPIDEGGKRKVLDFGIFQRKAQNFIKSKGSSYIKNVLGPGRYKLLQEGKISYEDLIDKKGEIRLLERKNGKYVGLK